MQVIAHRGAKGYVPENTLAAFQKALEMGAHGIELDVHLSADGAIMVFHDEQLLRLTGNAGLFKEQRFDQLRLLRVAGRHQIPTLAEVLDLIDRKILVNIELKTGEAAIPVCRLIEQYVAKGWDYQQFLVSSFDWVCLSEIKLHFPHIPIGVLTETDLELAIGFARSIGAESLHPHFHLLDGTSVALIRETPLRLYAWTVNMEEDIARVRNLGPDGLITDYPDRV